MWFSGCNFEIVGNGNPCDVVEGTGTKRCLKGQQNSGRTPQSRIVTDAGYCEKLS